MPDTLWSCKGPVRADTGAFPATEKACLHSAQRELGTADMRFRSTGVGALREGRRAPRHAERRWQMPAHISVHMLQQQQASSDGRHAPSAPGAAWSQR